MKKIHALMIIISLALCAGGCIKNNYWDSGISNGRFDGSLLEYLEASGHSYDWDSVALIVHRAGPRMEQLFEGKDPEHPEITFFGPTNLSIKRYMIENKINRIEDMPVAWCEELLLRHIVDGKIYRDDVPTGKPATGGVAVGTGGITYTTLAGTHYWMYSYTADFNNVDGMGATTLYMTPTDKNKPIPIATTNIEPDHCVVHSLGYLYTLEVCDPIE